MNPRVPSTDFKRFEAEQTRRTLSRIGTMIGEFLLIAAKLDAVVAAEETRAGIFDPKHFAYPCHAKAAAQRRDNLFRSVDDMKLLLEMELADRGSLTI
jgi:flagellar FliJ protein